MLKKLFSVAGKKGRADSTQGEPARQGYAKDIFDNDAVPAGEAAAGAPSPRYRSPFVPLGISLRLAVVLLALVFVQAVVVSISSYKAWTRDDAVPLVFGPDAVGKLVNVEAVRIDPNVDLIEQFLDFTISNLMSMRDGELVGLQRVRASVAQDVILKFTDDLVKQAERFKSNGTNVNVKINRIDTSDMERFVINRRYKFSAGMVYGSTIITTRAGGATAKDVRWDFKVDFIKPTQNNPWGLFLTQCFLKLPSDPKPSIPANMRLPQDIAPVKEKRQ